jgi:hypothetical protein
MSAPISRFSRLSISKMQSSRGHARGHSGGKGKGKAPVKQDDPSSSEDDSNENSQGSDSGGEEQDEGTDTAWSGRVFALDHCRQHGTRYAFQIAYAEVERYSIRISTTDSGNPTCSCREDGTCRHIVWLLEQISRTTGDTTEPTTPSTPYEQISTRGLSNVCEELHWEFREGTDSDTEETKWQLKKDYTASELGRQTRGMIKERMKVVRDIMATLSRDLPEDYRRDIFESPDDVTMESTCVTGDLEATLSRLMILDDDLFHKFKDLVSRDTRATEFFRKMELKAQDSLDLLDKYCEVGPDDGKYDVIWCAQTLIDIVNSISANVAERQPLSPASREEAAKALVSILRVVVKKRNVEAYQNITWQRRRPHGEAQMDRNLYQRLIGSSSRSNPAGGNFVIKALQELPEAQRFVDELADILATLETIGWGPAPYTYRSKLSELITQLKRGETPSSSLGKRPASSMDRKFNKRMK